MRLRSEQRGKIVRAAVTLTLSFVFLLFSAPAEPRVRATQPKRETGQEKVFQPKECRRGPVVFSEAFSKYFDSVGERFVGKDEAWIRKTMEGEDRNRYELELLATPALPENYAFLLSRMGCWMQIYDYLQAMQRGSFAESDSYLEAWRVCLGGIYTDVLPPLAREVLACHASARASGLPKNFPKEMKRTQPDESTLVPRPIELPPPPYPEED